MIGQIPDDRRWVVVPLARRLLSEANTKHNYVVSNPLPPGGNIAAVAANPTNGMLTVWVSHAQFEPFLGEPPTHRLELALGGHRPYPFLAAVRQFIIAHRASGVLRIN